MLVITYNIQCNIKYLKHSSTKVFYSLSQQLKRKPSGDSLGGSVVENLPYNEGNMGSIPGWGTKIPHARKQLLSPCPKTTDPRDTAREPLCPN